ncbi:30S ribosomal protein S3 [Candidatus Woesearchaeota archaeon]|nr:30S ribosomal protein S3 [Candidatus Woesearchaeota archaeon]
MIEREIITQKIKEFQIKEFIEKSLKGVGLSHTKIQRTPLGEKIIIYASRPGLIIGGGGSNIKKLTKELKRNFGLENPQIEITEVRDINIIAQIVAERIASALERYGSVRFKGVGHKAMSDVLNAGALGVEILISGKIPSARARTWRFYQGYLKKCGNIALTQVDTAYTIAKLKTGIVGIKVSIMPPDTRLPDDVKIKKEENPVIEEIEGDDVLNQKIQEETEKESSNSKKSPNKEKNEK